MVYARLLTSPDASRAECGNIDASSGTRHGRRGRHPHRRRRLPDGGARAPALLTNEPVYVGDPILAIAAGRREDGRKRHRRDQARSGTAALHGGPRRQPAPQRPQRQNGRQRVLLPGDEGGRLDRKATSSVLLPAKSRADRHPTSGATAIWRPASTTPR